MRKLEVEHHIRLGIERVRDIMARQSDPQTCETEVAAMIATLGFGRLPRYAARAIVTFWQAKEEARKAGAAP
jgi:hypothetical protein